MKVLVNVWPSYAYTLRKALELDNFEEKVPRGCSLLKMPMAKWVCYTVGFVFIITGLAKLLFDDFQIYFNNLDLPYPQTLLLIVAVTEIVCGALIASRFYVKEASVPLIIIMLGAICLTKLPLLTEQGLFQFLFSARLDIVLLVLLLVLWKHVRGQKFN